MGILRDLRPGIRSTDLAAAVAGQLGIERGPVPLQLASPWAPRHNLSSVVWADIFGTKLLPVTRAEAMSVPAMARARHIICGFARIPLRGYRGPDPMDAGPTWITSTTAVLSPWHRMLWTLDDLVFSGWSCWSRVNGTDGKPIQMDRLPMNRWEWGTDIEGRTVVLVDGQVAASGSIVLIPGPHEGLLSFAQSSVRHAADLQRAAGRAAKHPAAYLALKQTGGTPLPKSSTDPNVMTIDLLMDSWAEAREGEHGGVGFLSENVDVKELGTFDKHLVLDGRNAAAVDIARLASLPADLLDAAGPASFTYSNSRDNDRRALDYGAGLYLSAISAALSQDAVMPHGQRVAFDLEQWLEGTVPGQAVETTPAQPAQPAPAAAPPARPVAVVR